MSPTAIKAQVPGHWDEQNCLQTAVVLAHAYHLVSLILSSAPEDFPYYLWAPICNWGSIWFVLFNTSVCFVVRFFFSGHVIHAIGGNGSLIFASLPSWFPLSLDLSPPPHRGMEWRQSGWIWQQRPCLMLWTMCRLWPLAIPSLLRASVSLFIKWEIRKSQFPSSFNFLWL